MFNKKIISKLKSEINEKQKQIWELQDEKVKLKTELDKNPGLKSVIANKDAEIQSLKQQIDGERVCTGYCSACEHGIPVEKNLSITFLFERKFLCHLSCICKRLYLRSQRKMQRFQTN